MASAAEQDESIGFLVKEVYWPFIVSHVRCCHLLLLIPGMAGHPESIRIQRLDRNCQYKEAAEAFLSAMEEQEIPGKWTSFLKALDEMEYEYVASVIRGGADLDSEDVTICKNLISEVFGQTICQVVVISDLMPSLISEGLIDDQSKEELQACENNHGNSEAMMFLLIGHLWRKRKDWYHRFLKVLYSEGHQELVRLIDPNKYEKIKAEVGEKENNAHTAQRELVASASSLPDLSDISDQDDLQPQSSQEEIEEGSLESEETIQAESPAEESEGAGGDAQMFAGRQAGFPGRENGCSCCRHTAQEMVEVQRQLAIITATLQNLAGKVDKMSQQQHSISVDACDFIRTTHSYHSSDDDDDDDDDN